MNFKQWLLQLEALDANTKNLLAMAKAPKQELDAFIKELEDEPTLIDKKTAFQRFQAKFNIQNKEKPKDEDAQRKHFATIPNTTEDELKTYDYYKSESPQALKEMMELLRKFIDKKLITLEIKDNKPVITRNTTQGKQEFDTPKFSNFTDALHQIQSSLQKYTGKGNYFNPIEEELNHQNNLVAKGDNIWVFKGHAPDVCRIYGKGHPWCISSSTSAAYWFSYRMEHHQTQYFVFDYNKDEDDPARYVNPGVAPEGMYSEWVDAKNKHSEDPEDPKSHVGINGYRSINEYKKYLKSKGIPEEIWVTTKPEEWEKRLSNYDDYEVFQGAKKDPDPRVFPMYLKIRSRMKDSDFDTLDVDQKKEFLLGKIDYITDKQFDYALKNIKSEYYNSLNLKGKIKFARKTNNQDLLLKLAENPNVDDEDVRNLITYATDKDNMAELIIKYKKELSDSNVENLLGSSTDKDKIAELIIEKKPKLSNRNVENLLGSSTDKDKIAELIINKKPELSDNNVIYLLFKANDKDRIAKLLGKDNINKLSGVNVETFLRSRFYKDEIAEIIIKYKKELSDAGWSLVKNFMQSAYNRDKIAKLIIKYHKKLDRIDVFHLLAKSENIKEIAELLQKETNNINKLISVDVWNLIDFTTNKKQMAQILNQYHQNKTPEIQKLLDKYL